MLVKRGMLTQTCVSGLTRGGCTPLKWSGTEAPPTVSRRGSFPISSGQLALMLRALPALSGPLDPFSGAILPESHAVGASRHDC